MDNKPGPIPEWKIPPAQEVVMRHLKGSGRRKVSRRKTRRSEDISSRDDETIKHTTQGVKPDSLCYLSDGFMITSISSTNRFPVNNNFKEKHKTRKSERQRQRSPNNNEKHTSQKNQPDANKVISIPYACAERETHPLTSRQESPEQRQSSRISSPRKHRSKSLINRWEQPPPLSQIRPTTCHSTRHSHPPQGPDHIPTGTPRGRPQSSLSTTSSCTIDSMLANSGCSPSSAREDTPCDEHELKSKSREECSDDYDTDCEPELNMQFRKPESQMLNRKQDSGIGHLSYEEACLKYKVTPRRRVQKQLWEKKLDLRHGGFMAPEIKAVAAALVNNTRVEDVDLSGNFMTETSITYMCDVLLDNIYITALNVSGSKLEMSGATACCEMLSQNTWLLSLGLSDCSIGDNEAKCLAQGLQANRSLQHLDLSKNEIGLSGGIHFGRTFGENRSLVTLNLSWNHIRGGGAVAICNSLQKNKKIEDLDLSWNGFGFEGSLALSESLRVNRSLKNINLENNRINWDCSPYLAKGLAGNDTLEVLKVGHNPLSVDGCEEMLMAIAKPTSRIKLLSLSGVPISTKVALIATDVAKSRDFSLEHGGILASRDVIGIQKARREDPFSLLIRYLSAMGIRVMDLFRMFDRDNALVVSREKFIQGLKRARVPLDDDDILRVAKRLESNQRGLISYQELANTVRNRIREDREEDRKQKIFEKKKREERRRILHSDDPLNAPNSMTAMYSMYGSREKASRTYKVISPILGSFSRRSSGAVTSLPRLRSERNLVERSQSLGEKSPTTLIRQSTTKQLFHRPLSSCSQHSSNYDDTDRRLKTLEQQTSEPTPKERIIMESYVNQMKLQKNAAAMRRQRFLYGGNKWDDI